jgi:GntR family transcriptional regulator
MATKPKLTLRLDFHSGLPIYIQIVNQVQALVVNQRIKVGDQLPTVRELAAMLNINFNTVARAYRVLDQARIISTQHGRGTFVLEIPPTKVTEKLRRDSLLALSTRYVEESIALGFSSAEIRRVVLEQLSLKNEA